MKYCTIPAGPFEVNTYLVYNDDGLNETGKKEGFIIDPGGQEKKIETILSEENIELKFILNTHCHIDHVIKDNYFKEKYKLKIYANPSENIILKNLKSQAEYLGFNYSGEVVIDHDLKDGEEIDIKGVNIKTIFTPGHSPGGVSFLVNGLFLFSGDTLFKNTIGRTDLLGGSSDQIVESIKNRLLSLCDTVVVLPGHGSSSTIGEEKKFNPYLI